MKHKVAELEGALLDAAVAKALGHRVRFGNAAAVGDPPDWWVEVLDAQTGNAIERTAYSSEWADGGPIIERERITVGWNRPTRTLQDILEGNQFARAPYWNAIALEGKSLIAGQTALAAAMRAFVASKFGEEVELP